MGMAVDLMRDGVYPDVTDVVLGHTSRRVGRGNTPLHGKSPTVLDRCRRDTFTAIAVLREILRGN
jgi:hypothetical protein